MLKNDTHAEILEFAEFQIDAIKRIFSRSGVQVPLTPKVFDTLLYLVANAGRVVDKDELMSAIWKDTVVEENNLNKNISTLRQILGENPGENRFIATIPGTGYKFVAPVTRANDFTSFEAGHETNEHPSDPPIDYSLVGWRGYGHHIVIGSGLLVLIFIGAFYFFTAADDLQSASPLKRMAVLPFRPLVEESRDEAFEIGMADTLIARLSSNPDLVVRPIGSVRRFARVDEDPQAAGRALGVESVLEGSIQRWGEKIRVNVRLIRVVDGTSLWSGSFDESFTDIFSVQDAIATKVAEALRVSLRNGRSSTRSTANVEAYRMYLQGRFFTLKATPPDIVKGIAFYQQAIEADPLYALAYAGMADAYRMQPIISDVDPSDAFPRAKQAALRALEFDNGLTEAHVALGWVASWYEWDNKVAEDHLSRAIENEPNNAEARRAYSVHLTKLGRHEEAVREMTLALELDPLSLLTNALKGQALNYSGRKAEAVTRLEKTLELDDRFWIARLQLGRIYIDMERYDDAIRELEKARDGSGSNSETLSLIGYAHARSCRADEARKQLEALTAREGLTPFYNIAMVHNGLGESEIAIGFLEKALDRRDIRMILLGVEPKWDHLRGDPAFIKLLQQMDLR